MVRFANIWPQYAPVTGAFLFGFLASRGGLRGLSPVESAADITMVSVAVMPANQIKRIVVWEPSRLASPV